MYKKTIESMLGAILAAGEPLPVEILQKLFNWKETELRKWLRKFGFLFSVTKTNDGETIKPYHKSLEDWLGDEGKAGMHFISAIEGHRLLADGWKLYEKDIKRMPSYFSQLLTHLTLIQQTDKTLRLRAWYEVHPV